jgi:hypothetical protein
MPTGMLGLRVDIYPVDRRRLFVGVLMQDC